MSGRDGWEAVIGLEIHVQLSTRTKMFCGCEVTFGDPPNTHVCPVCLGHPGVLPVTNEKAVEYATRIDSMAPEIYRYLNFDKMPDFVDSANHAQEAIVKFAI